MFDINTAVGHWPFRQIPNQTAGELRAHLESHGITGAAVAQTHSLFYKNTQDGNLELVDEIAPHRDFFVGIATLNPRYAAWQRDLETCVAMGLSGLRLVPQYHDYSLSDGLAVAIAEAAAELNLPILIPHRVVDVRQSHWLDVETTIAPAEVAELCGKLPSAKVILTEFPASPGSPNLPNLFYETSRMYSAYGQNLAAAVEAFGDGRFFFGTGAPFKEVEPSLLKLHHADLSPESRAAISRNNALKLFRPDKCPTC